MRSCSCTELACGMVHGVARTAELLLERGVPSVAPLLPSCGEVGGPVAGVRACPKTSRQSGRCCRTAKTDVVVAHSYGGSSPLRQPPGQLSAHLMLVSSYLPKSDRAFPTSRRHTRPFLDVDPDSGTFGVRPEFSWRRSCKTVTRHQPRLQTSSRGKACT